MKINASFLGEKGYTNLLKNLKKIEIDLNPKFHWINLYFKDEKKIPWEHILSPEEIEEFTKYIQRFIADYFPKLKDKKFDIIEITED